MNIKVWSVFTDSENGSHVELFTDFDSCVEYYVDSVSELCRSFLNDEQLVALEEVTENKNLNEALAVYMAAKDNIGFMDTIGLDIHDLHVNFTTQKDEKVEDNTKKPGA